MLLICELHECGWDVPLHERVDECRAIDLDESDDDGDEAGLSPQAYLPRPR